MLIAQRNRQTSGYAIDEVELTTRGGPRFVNAAYVTLDLPMLGLHKM